MRDLPPGVTLEKPGRNLDSLAPTDALSALKATLIHEWNIRGKFKDVEQFGIRPTTLALFHGPPGNGKTMAAKMLAKATGSVMYRVACDGLLGSHLGESEKKMAAVMKFLETAGQCVVLFDECESLFRSRRLSDGQCDKAIASTMQVFWQALDRWETPQMFLLATNLRHDIDEALLSRCEIQLEFVGPTADQTAAVLTYWEETLHEHGVEKWGPKLREQFGKEPPVSFRELWQAISHSVRQHIISAK